MAEGKGRQRRSGSLLRKALNAILRAVSLYGAAIKLIQLVPALLGLVAVALTPDAWLSATLRRWAIGGTLVGSLAGVIVLALLLRVKRPGTVAATSLLVVLVAGLLLRLHLAVVSVPFIEAYPLFQPLFDFYLGTGEWQARLYNLLAALLFAVVIGSATVALPSWLAVRRHSGEAERSEGGTELRERALVLEETAGKLSSEVSWLVQQLDALEDENKRLRTELQRAAARKATESKIAENEPLPADPTELSRKASASDGS